MPMTHEQLTKTYALKTERNEIFRRLTTESMPDSERLAWTTRMIAIDNERGDIEAAATVTAPVQLDPEAQTRAERARQIRATPGFFGEKNDAGEPVLSFPEAERLRRELVSLEIPGLAGPGPAA